MSRPLYAIGEDLLQLNDLLEACEGDLSRVGELEPAVTAWLTSLEAEQAWKLDGYVNLVRQLEMEAAAAQSEAEQWQAKAGARRKRAEYLKDRLKRHLEATGQPKVMTATGRTVAVVGNGGQRPVAIRDGADPMDYPAKFRRWSVEFDRAAVRTALECGEDVPFASLAERGTHLRVS